MNYMGSLTVYCILLAGYVETKNPKTSGNRKIAKICKGCFIIEQCIKKLQMKWANSVDPEEQSDLSHTVCPDLSVQKLRIIMVSYI